MNVGTYFSRYRPGILFLLGITKSKKPAASWQPEHIQIWLKLISYSSGNPEY